MPSLKSIRDRIRSVKNTQQITRAMKMVAASRLRRAQEAMLAARPYSRMLNQIFDDLVRRDGLGDHPLLRARPVKKVELVVLTSDRGLCGGFNANAVRETQRFLLEHEGLEPTLRTIGRKGYEFCRQRGMNIRQDHAGLLARLNAAESESIAEDLSALYLGGEVDAVQLIYNEFVSPVTQRVRMLQLLPLELPAPVAEEGAGESLGEYLFEPGRQPVVDGLLPRCVANRLWQALLESLAAENAARMAAMDNATKNAAEMIDKLTLQYNRSRQAAITTQLVEVVSGAEALSS